MSCMNAFCRPQSNRRRLSLWLKTVAQTFVPQVIYDDGPGQCVGPSCKYTIAQLITITTQLVGYINDLKDTPKDRARLAMEVASL